MARLKIPLGLVISFFCGVRNARAKGSALESCAEGDKRADA